MTLRARANEFVETLNNVLNKTVTDGIRMEYYGDRYGLKGYVGYDLRGGNNLVGEPIPVTLGNKKATCWLRINQTVTLEEDGYLKTTIARVAVYSDSDGRKSLVRYDFNRDLENEYAPAHVQVKGSSVATVELGIGDLEDLHLPVGGVRFRPCLEDVIEFLIVHNLAEPRGGWQKCLDESRLSFHSIQLKAAVRNQPAVAISQLKSMGYRVTRKD